MTFRSWPQLVVSLALIAFLLLACTGGGRSESLGARSSENTTFHYGVPVRTDARVYYLTEFPDRFDAYAVATYTNRTQNTVYFKRCRRDSDGPMYEIQRVDGKTADALVKAVWACVGGVPTGTIRPGGSLSARVFLGSAKSPNADPPDRRENRVGTFRILFQLCRSYSEDSDYCAALDDESRRSDPFEIKFRT